MEVKALHDILIKILRCELNGTELDASDTEQLTPEVIHAVFLLSKRHDIAHITASLLHRCGLLADKDMIAKFNREEIMCVYRYEQMKYVYEQICSIFDERSIPYIPLKGAVIRPYYPKECMRTSCDIDILVKEENLNAAIGALKENGFICGERDYHDVSLYSPNKIHLELHFNIQENNDKLDAVLKAAWEYATLVHGSCYKLTDEFFLFYIFAHISHHFLSGGCGIRSLMDIWVIENKMGISYQQAKNLLEKAGIYKFAEELSRLAENCFFDKPKDDFSYSLLSYIFDGGVFGNLENSIAINDNKTHVNFKYILKRIGISYDGLIAEYPIIARHRWLYILCWLHRTFKLSLRLIKNTLQRHKAAKTVSDTRTNESLEMRKRLGL